MNDFINKNKVKQYVSFNSPGEKIMGLLNTAKEDFNALFASLKVTLVEFILSSERELLAGPKYHPIDGWSNWGTHWPCLSAG